MQSAFIILIRQKLEKEQSDLRLQILQCLTAEPDQDAKLILQQLSGPADCSWPELLQNIYSVPVQQLRNKLEMVEAALSQIQIGQYGSCSDCEKPIDSETLLRDPTEQRCELCRTRRRY